MIVANTFTTLKEIDPYLQMAAVLGVPVKIICCIGNYKTTHGVPQEVIEKMENRWEEIEEEAFYDPDPGNEVDLARPMIKVIKTWLNIK